jgi:hypothetical protein
MMTRFGDRRSTLDEFVAASPWPQRAGLRLLLELGRRPRGLTLLGRLGAADQAAAGLLGMARYDEPEVARGLGFDANAVIARGRKLRREDGRP